MSTSSIKMKEGVCLDCRDGVKKRLVAGRCQTHYWIHRASIKAKKKSVVSDFRFPKREDSSEKVSTVAWYADKMATSEPVCENCGDPINRFNVKGWHGSQAHILPKGLFPSVANNKYNHMVLGMYGCNCHGQYDSSWLNASRMNIFAEAKRRFLLFEKDIAEEERSKIPEYFLQ